MSRYLLKATCYKLFSISSLTRNFYRYYANIFGSRRRLKAGIPQSYIKRANWISDILSNHNIIKDNDRVLELGTGWVHWESLVIRLLYNVEIVLFDIWDNRQLNALKKYALSLVDVFAKRSDVKRNTRPQIEKTIQQIQTVKSYSELYEMLNWSYIVEPSGILNNLSDNSFNLIYSYNVFEHIHVSLFPEYINQIHRILKPGGFSIHKIDISDHYANYDMTKSDKEYLRFSKKLLKSFFDNDIEYINHIPRSKWLHYFQESGLTLVDENSLYFDIKVPVHFDHQHLSKKDIDCVTLTVIHQKQ